MYFEITYDGELIATCLIQDLSIGFLEELFVLCDEEYGLSEAYETPSEWITDLRLALVYT